MAEKDVWFRYGVTAGRFSATPVNLKGWLALIAIVTIPTALFLAALPYVRARGAGPWITFVFLAVNFAVIFPGMIMLVKAKGRRVT